MYVSGLFILRRTNSYFIVFTCSPANLNRFRSPRGCVGLAQRHLVVPPMYEYLLRAKQTDGSRSAFIPRFGFSDLISRSELCEIVLRCPRYIVITVHNDSLGLIFRLLSPRRRAPYLCSALRFLGQLIIISSPGVNILAVRIYCSTVRTRDSRPYAATTSVSTLRY